MPFAMPASSAVPEDPLTRFLALQQALFEHRSWTESHSALRYAAVSLTLIPGPPSEVAERSDRLARELKERAGWFGELRSSARHAIAADLLRRGVPARIFTNEVDRVREMFRAEKLPRGGLYEVLAVLILHGAEEGAVRSDAVRRVASIFRRLDEDHRFLTGRDDLPACALLSLRPEPVEHIATRLESLYSGLRDLKFHRGNQLQLASHLLFFGPHDDAVSLRRFRAIYEAFREDGLWMNGGDYDEVALLAFLDVSPNDLVRRVAAHRERLRAGSPRPGKQESFSLACNTVLLELAGRDLRGEWLDDAAQMARIVGLIQAQQAAAAAAAS